MTETEVSPVPGVARWSLRLSLIGVVTWVVDILTRPPCLPNYVRLLDWEVAVPPLLLIISGASWAIRSSSEEKVEDGGTPGRIAFFSAIIMLSIAALFLALSVLMIIRHRSAYDDACWTF